MKKITIISLMTLIATTAAVAQSESMSNTEGSSLRAKAKGKVGVRTTKTIGSLSYTWRVLSANTSTVPNEPEHKKSPFKFVWVNNHVSTNVKNLSEDTYTVYTIDSKGSLDTSIRKVDQSQPAAVYNERKQNENPVKGSYGPEKVKFNVFPNPNNGEFTVDISGLENNHDVKLVLRNEKGSNVYETSFNVGDESSIRKKITPETKLNNGFYFCSITIEGVVHTIKVVVD